MSARATRGRLRASRRILASIATAAVIVAVLAGCGDIYADPEDPAIPPSSQEDAAVSPPPEAPVECPPDRPRENGPCFAIGSTCEYGRSADELCNTVLSCRGSPNDGYWEANTNDQCHARACPAAAEIATLDGKPCSLGEPDGGPVTDADEAICNVTDGVCACTTGPNGASAHPRRWTCVRPISMCPTSRPLAGHPCSGGLYCDYGTCEFKRGPLMECKNGTWLLGGKTCP
jgi:hypothetical protein